MELYSTYQLIKRAVASNEEILAAARSYYNNEDPDDPKRRWDHMLDVMEVAKKIRGRELNPTEFGMIAFHDSGYKHPKGYAYAKSRHPGFGAKIFRKEGPKLGYTPEEIKRIAKVIAYHNHRPNYESSPLLKDDLQMLLFSADEGTPIDLKEDAKRYYVKGKAGVYKGVDPNSQDFIKQLVKKVKTFGDNSEELRFKYYNDVYPGYLKDRYNFWQSKDIEDYYNELNKQASKQPDISDIVNAYKEQYGIDLSHMKPKWSKYPRYNNGKIAKDIPVDSYGGSWAKNNTIYLNSNLQAVMKYYGLEGSEDDLRRTISAHELAHEIYKRQATQEFIKNILAEAKKKKFNTVYLDTVPEHKRDEETFCEYLANNLKQASKDITFPSEEIDSLKGKDRLYTTRVSSDYDKYNLGDTVTTPWGDNYVIDSEDTYDDVKKHKFYDELTDEQKKLLSQYKVMKLLGLTKKASRLYTYVDPEADLSQGLLSMRNAPEFAIINKYKNRVKDPANLNKEYLIKRMEELDPTKPDWIYAFDAPIPDKANEGLLRFRDTHKLVEWDPEQVKDVIKILRRYHSSKTREEVPANFKPLKYMRWIKGKDNMSFRHAPVYKVLTESGRIPPELLTYE